MPSPRGTVLGRADVRRLRRGVPVPHHRAPRPRSGPGRARAGGGVAPRRKPVIGNPSVAASRPVDTGVMPPLPRRARTRTTVLVAAAAVPLLATALHVQAFAAGKAPTAPSVRHDAPPPAPAGAPRRPAPPPKGRGGPGCRRPRPHAGGRPADRGRRPSGRRRG